MVYNLIDNSSRPMNEREFLQPLVKVSLKEVNTPAKWWEKLPLTERSNEVYKRSSNFRSNRLERKKWSTSEGCRLVP